VFRDMPPSLHQCLFHSADAFLLGLLRSLPNNCRPVEFPGESSRPELTHVDGCTVD